MQTIKRSKRTRECFYINLRRALTLAGIIYLAEKGIDVPRYELDYANQGHRSPEYLQINPSGRAPALVITDGTTITESAAIVECGSGHTTCNDATEATAAGSETERTVRKRRRLPRNPRQ